MHMDFFMNVLGKKVFGSSSSSSVPPRQHQRSDAPEYDSYSTNIADVRGRGGASSKSDGKQLHSVVNAALWAIARTPALVHAIDQVETFSGENHLTSVLEALGDRRVLDDSVALVGAAEQAETFLGGSRMSLYDSMEPMDAIRGIMGLCGDSQRVIENVMRTTYRKTKACTVGGCTFEVDEGLRFEESLMCTRETAQQTVDARANPASITKLCTFCMKWTAAEKIVLEVPPRACLVAVWKPLRAGTKGVQENLILRDRLFQEFRFKSSVVIANHQGKLVCMFRDGQNYYRIVGHDLKEVSVTDWLRVKPLLAIFNRQASSDTRYAGVSSSYVGRGFGRSGRRDRRQDSIESSRGDAIAGSAGKVSPSEVIEVNDDDVGTSESRGDEVCGSRPNAGEEGTGARPQWGGSAGSDTREKKRVLKQNPPDALYGGKLCESPEADRGFDYAGPGNVNGERPRAGLKQAREKAIEKAKTCADIVDIDAGEADAGENVYATIEDPWFGRPRRAAPSAVGLSYDPWLRRGGSWGARCGREAEGDSKSKKMGIRRKPSSPRSWGSLIGDARNHKDLSKDGNKSDVESFDDEVQLITGEACSSTGTGAAGSASNVTRALGGTRSALNDVSTADERSTYHREGAVAAQSTSDRDCVFPGDHGDAITESPFDSVKISAKVPSRCVEEAPTMLTSPSWQDQRNAISPPNILAAHSVDSDSSSKFSLVEMSVEESPPSGMKMSFMGQPRPPSTESSVREQQECPVIQLNDNQARANGKYHALRERGSGYDGVARGAGGRTASLPPVGECRSVNGGKATLSSLWGITNATKKDTVEKVDAEGDVWGGMIRRSKRRKACGAAGDTFDGGEEWQAMEDLTGADEQEQGAVRKGIFAALASRRRGGQGETESTLTTIRGINLRQEHFERIVDSDGWLTSQIIDVRVKQLQEKFPQNLYYDSSFFGFLCPTIEKGGDFLVDYERVRRWTKRSRLPTGKSSIFEMRKLFIPVNQGNVHWVLVVVDMGGAGGDASGGSEGNAKGSFKVNFFDSFGRDGALYVQAVQQYLVSELSSRDKYRQSGFILEPRPPPNAPQQQNSSDCGVLMLHVMEELSTGPISKLTWLTQEEIISLRYKLVEKIRE